MTALERVAVALASVILSVVLIALLSGFFTSRDNGALAGPGAALGQRFRDLGNTHLRRGQPPPRYDSNPPTSGAHVPERITRDQARIDDNQLLEALALGDVVIVYGTRVPPAGLRALTDALAPPFSPALARSGEAVILASRPGTVGLLGLAWTAMLRVRSAGDPRLGEFAAFWLGRGAPRRG